MARAERISVGRDLSSRSLSLAVSYGVAGRMDGRQQPLTTHARVRQEQPVRAEEVLPEEAPRGGMMVAINKTNCNSHKERVNTMW